MWLAFQTRRGYILAAMYARNNWTESKKKKKKKNMTISGECLHVAKA